MSTQSRRTSQYKGKRPRKPSDPRYTPKGGRTDKRQRKRRPQKRRRQQFRSGGIWVAIRGANTAMSEFLKFFLLPIIIPIRAFKKWRTKQKE